MPIAYEMSPCYVFAICLSAICLSLKWVYSGVHRHVGHLFVLVCAFHLVKSDRVWNHRLPSPYLTLATRMGYTEKDRNSE